MSSPLALQPEAIDDPRNALYLARACALAYLPGPEGTPRFQSELGLTSSFFTAGNTQAYVAHSDTEVVVAFRGSERPNSIDGFKDWLLTNANNFLVVPEGRIGTDFAAAGVGARFHRGFMAALDDIWEPVLKATEPLTESGERRLWVTGHSLGGAIALLAAWRFLRHYVDVHAVYTYGAPMIGNELAAKAFEDTLGGRIFRYVDRPDPVPLLPVVSLIAAAFKHCPTEIPLGPEQSAAQETFKQFAKVAVDGLLKATLLDEFWTAVTKRLDAHQITNYETLIAERCPKS